MSDDAADEPAGGVTSAGAGAGAVHGHATHDELVAAVAALLAARRRGSATRPVGERSWRATRLAALGLLPRR